MPRESQGIKTYWHLHLARKNVWSCPPTAQNHLIWAAEAAATWYPKVAKRCRSLKRLVSRRGRLKLNEGALTEAEKGIADLAAIVMRNI